MELAVQIGIAIFMTILCISYVLAARSLVKKHGKE